MIQFPFKVLNNGYQEQYQTSYVETTPDAGSNFRRQTFSDVGRSITHPMLLTDSEKAVFDTFYLKDTKSGSDTFLYYDCINDIDRPAKFTGTPSIVRNGNRWNVSCNFWLEPVTITVELLLADENDNIIADEDGTLLSGDVERNI